MTVADRENHSPDLQDRKPDTRDGKPDPTRPLEPPASESEPPAPRVKHIYQPMDKVDKGFYSIKRMIEDLLRKKLFGTVIPGELVARIDMEVLDLDKMDAEVRDFDQTVVRRVDLLWKVRFRDSWLYLVLLFEAQSTVQWWMPLRIMQSTALVYGELAKDPEVRKHGKLPPVVPIVVYTGKEPWTAPTRVEDLLADEAKAFLPLALGQEYVLVQEYEEAKALEQLDTPRDAALQLRYIRNPRKYREALARLQELLPQPDPTRTAVSQWAQTWMVKHGVKENTVELMKQLEQLEGLDNAASEAWWDAHREEVQRTTLLRLARRKFGEATAEELAELLKDASERLDQATDLIIDCATGPDMLEQLRS